jgi:23S rRNA (uracil1939-C5)-methyltransferase
LKRHKGKLPFFEMVEIDDLAAEGMAIAKINLDPESGKSLILFVEQAVPGDIVDVQVSKKQKNFMQGYVKKFHKYSDLRIDARCEHFGTCGGCKWQMLPYSLQLKYKQKQVIDQLIHIGKIISPETLDILGSDEEYFYRNKLEFTFSNKRWLEIEEMENPDKQLDGLGFHIPGKFDKVLDLKNCYLQGGKSNEIRLFAKAIAKELGITFFDLREQNGFLRNLTIRNSLSTGDLMVIVSFFSENKKVLENFLNQLAKKFPEITSLMYVINPKRNDTITDLDVVLYKGKDHIIEEMEGLIFKIGPKSFFQTNSKQAYKLYSIAREFASFKGNEIVYDLYTGTGTIANFIANSVAKVVGIEYVIEAIEDARENSALNQIKNTSFFAGDMKDILNEEFIKINGKPDVIILDPPRAGVHPKVIDAILFANPDRIVYVSCNAATQARDIQLMSQFYKVDKIQPVDMFPQTAHVENVVLLLKIN